MDLLGRRSPAAGRKLGGILIETVIRRINNREGITADADRLPRRVLEESHAAGPARGRVIGRENFLVMRTEYYRLRGWDRDAVPLPETIAKHGLDEEPAVTL